MKKPNNFWRIYLLWVLGYVVGMFIVIVRPKMPIFSWMLLMIGLCGLSSIVIVRLAIYYDNINAK